MKDIRSLAVDPEYRMVALLCVVFIWLNVMDACLTGVALELGGRELNPLLRPTLGASIPVKTLLAIAAVIAVLTLRRDRLLKPLCVAMALVCVWNGFAIWSWI